MAYETGTSTSLDDLLDKLRIFALAQGWTVHAFATRTDNAGKCLVLSKDGVIGSFAARIDAGTANSPGNFLQAYIHDAYSGGVNIQQQANRSYMEANKVDMPCVAYHFFAGATYLYAVIETLTSIFKHVGIGTLANKVGSMTNGNYAFATKWQYHGSQIQSQNSGYHKYAAHVSAISSATYGAPVDSGLVLRADTDALTPLFHYDHRSGDTSVMLTAGNPSAGTARPGMRIGWGQTDGNNQLALYSTRESHWTGRVTFAPILVEALRTGSFYSPLGIINDIRYCHAALLNPGDVITIGSDDWKWFPYIRKNGPTGQPNSGVLGLAFRVDA